MPDEPSRHRRFGLADLIAFGALAALVARYAMPRPLLKAVPAGTPQKAAEA